MKISEAPVAETPGGDDTLPIVQGGDVKQIYYLSMMAAIAAQLGPAAQYVATSSSEEEIGVGQKFLSVDAGKMFSVGQLVVVASNADASNNMTGRVTQYDPVIGAFTIDAVASEGAGTFDDWTIGLTPTLNGAAIYAAIASDLVAPIAEAVGNAVTDMIGLAPETVGATESELQTLLDHDEDSIALVFLDPTPAKNGWYVKQGVSGVGSWVQYEKLSAQATASVQASIDAAIDTLDAKLSAAAASATAAETAASEAQLIAGLLNAPVDVAYSATLALDIANGPNFDVVLTGDALLENLTSMSDGKRGEIYVRQDATGGRRLFFGSKWRFPGGINGSIVSTAANAIDVISYRVNDGLIFASLTKAHAAGQTRLSVLTSLLSNSPKSAIFNLRDASTLWADSVTGGAVSSGGQFGRVFDVSKLGGKTPAQFIADQPELMPNSNFDSDTGFIKGPGTTWSGGQYILNSDAGTAGLDVQMTGFAAGDWMLITLGVASNSTSSSANSRIRQGTSQGSSAYGDTLGVTPPGVSGPCQIMIRAGGADPWLRFLVSGGSVVSTSWSVKKIPATFLLQPTAGARPTYNTTTGAVVDGLDDTFSWTPKGGLSSNMTIVIGVKTSDAKFILASDAGGSGSRYLGYVEDGANAPGNPGARAAIVIDGVTYPLSTNVDAIHAVIADGLSHVIEWRNVDMTTWSSLAFFTYVQVAGYAYGGSSALIIPIDNTDPTISDPEAACALAVAAVQESFA